MTSHAGDIETNLKYLTGDRSNFYIDLHIYQSCVSFTSARILETQVKGHSWQCDPEGCCNIVDIYFDDRT